MPGPYRGLIHQYREFMPLGPEVEPVTLNEGATPLLRLSNLERELETPVELSTPSSRAPIQLDRLKIVV